MAAPPATAATAGDVILDQTIRVRFDSSVERDFPWAFKPVERTTELRIGETGLAFYEAHNPTDQPIAGTASYNVTPYEAGRFFTKIDCFFASNCRCCNRVKPFLCLLPIS